MKKTITLLASLALAFLAQTTHAQVLAVDFGADYTSTNINNTTPAGSGFATGDYNFNGSSDDRAYIRPFGSRASFPGSPGFTTPAGKSGGVINYGISYANIGSLTDPSTAGLNRISAADVIQANSGAGTSTMRMASAWYWQKASFLNGLSSSSNISFADQVGSMTVTVANSGAPTTGFSRESRLLAQSDGQWYLSQTFTTTNGSLTINAYTANWYSFDPTANALFWNVSSPGSTVAGSTLTNITALGVYIQHELFDGRTGGAALQGFDSLQVTAIPEPSALGLLVGASAALLALRRRRR